MAELFLFIYIASVIGSWIILALGVQRDEIETWGILAILAGFSFVPVFNTFMCCYIGGSYIGESKIWNSPIKKVK